MEEIGRFASSASELAFVDTEATGFVENGGGDVCWAGISLGMAVSWSLCRWLDLQVRVLSDDE